MCKIKNQTKLIKSIFTKLWKSLISSRPVQEIRIQLCFEFTVLCITSNVSRAMDCPRNWYKFPTCESEGNLFEFFTLKKWKVFFNTYNSFGHIFLIAKLFRSIHIHLPPQKLKDPNPKWGFVLINNFHIDFKVRDGCQCKGRHPRVNTQPVIGLIFKYQTQFLTDFASKFW